MNWFVIYTKSRHEYKVSQALQELGIHAYCPMLNLVKQYSDRKKKVTQPLLPSYVFVKIKEKDREKVFDVPGAVRYLFWLGKPAVVKEKEIELLQNYLTGTYADVSLQNVQKGDLLTIPSGPFKGSEGTVLNVQKNKIRIVLSGIGIHVTLSRLAA